MKDVQHFDLSDFTLGRLCVSSDEVARELVVRKKIDDSRHRMKQIARRADLALKHVFRKPQKKKDSSLMHVKPEDRTQTRSGGRRTPTWLKTASIASRDLLQLKMAAHL